MVSDCKRGGTGCCNELQRMQGLSVRPASDLMPLNTQKIKQYAPLKSATARVGEGIEQLKSLPPAKRGGYRKERAQQFIPRGCRTCTSPAHN